MSRPLDSSVEGKMLHSNTYQVNEGVDLTAKSPIHPFTQSKTYQLFIKIDKWTFELVEKLIVASALLSLAAIVFILIVLRYTVSIAPGWSDELPRYLMVWLAFVGMSYCVRMGEHVAIDFLVHKFKGHTQKVFYFGILSTCFIFSLVLLYFGYSLYEKIALTGQTSVSLGISMAYVYISLPVGAFLMAKNFLHLIVLNLFSKGVVFSLKEGETL